MTWLSNFQMFDFQSYIRQAAGPILNKTHSGQYAALPHVHSHHIPDSQFPGLYRATHALVLPTHGEAWGRPQIEVCV